MENEINDILEKYKIKEINKCTKVIQDDSYINFKNNNNGIYVLNLYECTKNIESNDMVVPLEMRINEFLLNNENMGILERDKVSKSISDELIENGIYIESLMEKDIKNFNEEYLTQQLSVSKKPNLNYKEIEEEMEV